MTDNVLPPMPKHSHSHVLLVTEMLSLTASHVRLQTVKPRPSPVTSIPGLLGLFHNVRLVARVMVPRQHDVTCVSGPASLHIM
jgi:hypothetical protein